MPSSQEPHPPASEAARPPGTAESAAVALEEAWLEDVNRESVGKKRGRKLKHKKCLQEPQQDHPHYTEHPSHTHQEEGKEKEEEENGQRAVKKQKTEVLHSLPAEDQDAGGCYDNLAPPPGNEGMESAVRQLQSNFTDVLVKWGQAFSESEQYEAFCPLRLDELLRGAQCLEQSLLAQRRELKERLSAILNLL